VWGQMLQKLLPQDNDYYDEIKDSFESTLSCFKRKYVEEKIDKMFSFYDNLSNDFASASVFFSQCAPLESEYKSFLVQCENTRAILGLIDCEGTHWNTIKQLDNVTKYRSEKIQSSFSKLEGSLRDMFGQCFFNDNIENFLQNHPLSPIGDIANISTVIKYATVFSGSEEADSLLIMISYRLNKTLEAFKSCYKINRIIKSLLAIF